MREGVGLRKKNGGCRIFSDKQIYHPTKNRHFYVSELRGKLVNISTQSFKRQLLCSQIHITFHLTLKVEITPLHVTPLFIPG